MPALILLSLGNAMQTVLDTISPFAHEIVLTVMATVGISIVVWPFRKLRDTWQVAKDKLDAIQAELSVQRTNCLATIQTSNIQQVELLGKAVDTLGDIKTTQAEISGYLKGMSAVEVHTTVRPVMVSKPE